MILVPIETAIKRCHYMHFCGVDTRVEDRVTEARHYILACKITQSRSVEICSETIFCPTYGLQS